MATQKDEAAQLAAITDEINNIAAGIGALEAALASAGGTTPEVDAALANLKTAADAALSKLPAPPTPTPSPPPA